MPGGGGPLSETATMQQRRDEILAKKAKLEELKRQRALRAREASTNRGSVGSNSDVNTPLRV